MPSIYFGSISKRKNSTLQPTLTASYDCILKQPTSIDNPTFVIQDSSFSLVYNYAKWDNTYYFIDRIVSVRNNVWEVSCSIDVLATYKTEILASTQYVCYSASYNSSIWLPDTRLPILKSATVAKNVTSMNFVFNDVGFYVLSVIGKDGAALYMMDLNTVKNIINNISQWTDDLGNAIDGALPFSSPSDEKEALQNLATAVIKSGVLGNAYLDAPNCIRSCIWVPFFASDFTDGSSNVYLGQYAVGYPSNLSAFRCKATPVVKTTAVSIPWQFNDFRRATNEEIYLYIPLVGMVNLPSDEIINESTITLETSCTATDGTVVYRILAGNQIIGTYGANCSANFPIGISQQASSGEIINSVISGVSKTASAGNVVSGVVNAGVAAYDTVNVAMSRHNSCVGGIGGGAGAGLSLDVTCFSVAHGSVCAPADMAATMGRPVMKPYPLATLTGYCQCANAHVAAAAMGGELEMIDNFLNSGFYIE